MAIYPMLLAAQEYDDWSEEPVQDFLAGLTENEILILRAYLAAGSDRNRGNMLKLGKAYGDAFWRVEEKVKVFSDRHHCSVENIKDALEIALKGDFVSEDVLMAYAIPPKIEHQQCQVAEETRQKAKNTGIGGWFSRLIGRRA